jgi:hypothetical protein
MAKEGNNFLVEPVQASMPQGSFLKGCALILQQVGVLVPKITGKHFQAAQRTWFIL